MKFTFKDITNREIYESARVLYVTGPYNIFNNIAVDEIRESCKEQTDSADLDYALMADFGIDETQAITISNRLDFDNFTKTIHTACMSGKWFCSVDYSTLSKKHKTWVESYIKEPSSNGKLVLYCSDFKDYRLLLKNKTINNSTQVHLIQLSFPYRSALEDVVKALFEEKGVLIEISAIELFVMRMSNSYDDYDEVIDKIIVESVPDDLGGEIDSSWKYTITYQDAFNALKGIENFVLDDFIDRLLVPMAEETTGRRGGKNKIYKMMDALKEELGPIELVKKLRYKINDYIEFREAINSGIIPVSVRFSVPEAKQRLGEDSKLTKFSDYTFRKMAIIASKTSLKDWLYMKMILANIRYKYDKTSYEKALYTLINRSILNKSRINNDIGVENILNKQIEQLDGIVHSDEKLMFNGASTEEIIRKTEEMTNNG